MGGIGVLVSRSWLRSDRIVDVRNCGEVIGRVRRGKYFIVRWWRDGRIV